MLVSLNVHSKRIPYVRRERQSWSPEDENFEMECQIENESQISMMEEMNVVCETDISFENVHDLSIRRFSKCTTQGNISEHALLRPMLSPRTKLCSRYTISHFLRHDIYTDIYMATDARFPGQSFEIHVQLKEIEGESKNSRVYLQRKMKASKKSKNFHDAFKFEGFQLVVKHISNKPEEFWVRSYDTEFPLLPRLGEFGIHILL
ncbi:hypothetical protein BS50DRAFT_71321 [Corynespora cassiicola Philippines]|uniref:Uncharacterized protein n=1 Tax=Corynespora cassiicola Philippines TaxID=1448308 RepID=A0A2T2NFY2_CORCC|nr:hypothetical protein BS50DRAFT_71321 [Corynespora cassiicola Philippines]